MQGPGVWSLVSYYRFRVPQLRPSLSKIKKKKNLKTSKTQTAYIKVSIKRNKWTGSQIRQKSNSFLSPTGYPTQRQNKLDYSREKAPKGEEIEFPTVRTLRETYGYCLEPVCSQILIPRSTCPALEQPVRLWGVLKEEPQDKWSCQLLGPYPQTPQLLARHEWQGKAGQ